MLKFYYMFNQSRGQVKMIKKVLKGNDAKFLKFILGNARDNKEKHIFAQERSFYNF